MITRVLSAGLLAGLFAGLAIAVLQNFTTTPLILQAEVFENAAGKAASAQPSRAGQLEARVILVHSASEHAATAGEQEWAPGDGMERILYTSTATIAASIGFALLLIGGMLAAGERITEQRAIAWAAAGFVATGLAPAAGVSPELPGMAAADLVSRQAWWFLTAALTALSIWLFLRTESLPLRVLAVALLVAPHVLGAPHLAEAGTSKVPAELAARFAAMSLAVQAALWVATGYAAGFFWQRLEPRPAASGASAQT